MDIMQLDSIDDIITCPICFGESAEYLGESAGIPYYQCRHCGTQWTDDDAYDALLANLEN